MISLEISSFTFAALKAFKSTNIKGDEELFAKILESYIYVCNTEDVFFDCTIVGIKNLLKIAFFKSKGEGDDFEEFNDIMNYYISHRLYPTSSLDSFIKEVAEEDLDEKIEELLTKFREKFKYSVCAPDTDAEDFEDDLKAFIKETISTKERHLMIRTKELHETTKDIIEDYENVANYYYVDELSSIEDEKFELDIPVLQVVTETLCVAVFVFYTLAFIYFPSQQVTFKSIGYLNESLNESLPCSV